MKPVSSYYCVSPIPISTDPFRSSLSGDTLTIRKPWKMAASPTRCVGCAARTIGRQTAVRESEAGDSNRVARPQDPEHLLPCHTLDLPLITAQTRNGHPFPRLLSPHDREGWPLRPHVAWAPRPDQPGTGKEDRLEKPFTRTSYFPDPFMAIRA
jgi:hypothetical protein